ncbi:hypothetical protein GCM10010924_53290 [Rhizobium wenxiniae]|uniref:Uncharacterized protein n=1 Tax=Rhizobium wenxiniae TaxID=1737357 RepID=A0A7X0D2K0_9HYPH|nr:hypothetical protein [Rhizobium wenxiniae]GGG17520.1 hypothetical protein GCM10010924_53290 [Rhizobium wenxiniae]
MFSTFKFFQFIGSVFVSLVIALLVPYAFYRLLPESWNAVENHIGFGWLFGGFFLVTYLITMCFCLRILSEKNSAK